MQVQRFLTPGSDTHSALDAGRSLRPDCRRHAHAELVLPDDRDPLGTIETTHATRIAELIGVRIARMMQSVYAYYRGTVDVMTRDLAAGPTTGIELVIDADAHLGNFGLYASPERRLIFDLNDFDEAGVGPWEWDVKRLAVSLVLVQRSKGVDLATQKQDVAGLVTVYRDSLRTLVEGTALDRYFASVDAHWLTDAGLPLMQKSMMKARRRTSEQVLGKIGMRSEESGVLSLTAAPPLLMPFSDDGVQRARRRFEDYRYTLLTDRALLLSQFRVDDAARRVVGVSSVGTRCSIVLLQGPNGEPLVLQSKEALPSVLETQAGIPQTRLPGVPYPLVGPSGHDRHCRRVTESQRVLQSTSDPFLGRTIDPDRRNYYWRQFRDMKGSVDLDAAKPAEVRTYAELCGRLLARAHTQSPDAAAVAGYLGSGTSFATAVAEWSVAYANVVQADYTAFRESVVAGRFPMAEEAVA